jgi:hypothetical protein
MHVGCQVSGVPVSLVVVAVIATWFPEDKPRRVPPAELKFPLSRAQDMTLKPALQ